MGTELDIDTDDLETQDDETQEDLVEEEPKAPETPPATPPEGWDKARQDIDFERANARKARAELETMTEAYEQATGKLNDLQNQIAELRQAKQDEQDKLDDMDPDLVHEPVAKNIKTLERRLREKEQQLAQIGEKITRYEQQQAQAETQRRTEEARQSVFSTVEDVLTEAGIAAPGKYRNEANKLADRMVDSGEVVQPRTLADAVKLMTKCYLSVKKDSEAKGKSSKSVSVDTGKAGAEVSQSAKPTGIKPGRLADVKAQMLKNPSLWKG